jgi:hypothetical protein
MKDMNNDAPKQLTVPFVAICINDRDKPKEIPSGKWLTKGKRYNVLKLVKSMDGQPAFVLEEIELGEDTYPFDCFSAKRFGIPIPEIKKEEEVKEETTWETTIS